MISWLLFLGHLSKIACDGRQMFIVRTPGNAITKAIVDVHCKLGSASWELSLCQFCWDEQTQLSNDRGFEVISCRMIGLIVLTMLIAKRIAIITMTVMVSHMWILTSTSPSKLSTIFSASFKHFLAQLRFHHWLHTKWFGQAWHIFLFIFADCLLGWAIRAIWMVTEDVWSRKQDALDIWESASAMIYSTSTVNLIIPFKIVSTTFKMFCMCREWVLSCFLFSQSGRHQAVCLSTHTITITFNVIIWIITSYS